MTATAAGSGRRQLIFKNLVILYGTQIITLLLSLLELAYVPVYLNAAGMGRLAIAYAFTAIAGTMIALGTGNYIVREIARNRSQLGQIVGSAVLLRLTLAVGLLPFALAAMFVMGYEWSTCLVILVVYSSTTIRLVGEVFNLALQALENMGWRSTATLVWKICTVALGWLVLFRGGDVVTYAFVLVVAHSLELFIYLAYFVLVAPLRPAFHHNAVKQLVLGGIPFLMWGVLQMVYLQTNSLSLSKFGGEVAVGWYSTALMFVLPLYSIPGVAITLLLPEFSKTHVLSERAFQQAVSRSLSYIILITLPAALGLSVLSDRVIGLFNYPETFQHSIPVLRLIAYALPFTSITMIIATAVAAMKKERTWAYVSFISLVSLLILNVALVPLTRDMLGNAAIGAALGLLSAEIITIVTGLYLFGRSMIESGFFRTLGKTCLATIVMATAVVPTANLFLPVPIIVGVVTYGTAVLVFGVLPDDEVQALRYVLKTRTQPVVLVIRTMLMRGR